MCIKFGSKINWKFPFLNDHSHLLTRKVIAWGFTSMSLICFYCTVISYNVTLHLAYKCIVLWFFPNITDIYDYKSGKLLPTPSFLWKILDYHLNALPPTEWVTAPLHLQVKWLEHEAAHSPPFTAEVVKPWNSTAMSLYTSMTWCFGTGATLPLF